MTFNPETKKNIAKILALLFDSKIEIKPRIKSRILNELIWSATEDSDDDKSYKYSGQSIWSVKALRRLVDNKIIRRNNQKHDLFKHLRHEHIITKEEIIKVIKRGKVEYENYLNVLDRYAHAAVTDKDEEKDFTKAKCNRKTPTGYTKDVFIRYRLSNILLCKQVTIADIDNLNENNLEQLIEAKRFNF